MAGCSEKEFVNVLMLGSSNIKISQFIKLFSAYLKYDTSKEAMFYEPGLNQAVENVKETTRYMITIGEHNFHFIDVPGLQKSTKSYKELIDTLLHFKAYCRLHAIILLIEPDGKDNENYFEQYTTHFFSGLKQYAKNILYVFLFDDSSMHIYKTYGKLQKAFDIKISAIVPQKNNVFHLNVDTFYTVSNANWEESQTVSKELFDYITGSGLSSFYVQCVMPPEQSFFSLIYDILVVLVEVSHTAKSNDINKSFQFIQDYNKNVTACYNYEKCSTWNSKTKENIIKICHEDCVCTTSILGAEHCSMFLTANKNCTNCDCDITSHQRYIFDTVFLSTIPINVENKMATLQTILTHLFLFLKSYKSISIKDFISKEFYQSGEEDEVGDEYEILSFISDFEEALKYVSKLHFTKEKLIMYIYKLFEIKELAPVIPKIINKEFPDGLRLEIITKQQTHKHNGSENVIKSLEAKCQNMELENQNIKRDFEELKQRFDQLMNASHTNNLESHQDNLKKQNYELNINEDSNENGSNE